MRHDKFACLILTHGRADRVYTHKTLRDLGYTGKIYLVIDDEDNQAQEYIKIYGQESVITYNKSEWFANTQTIDLDGNRACVVPARNACNAIAKDLGLDYFLELDDDYSSFEHRYILPSQPDKLLVAKAHNIEPLFDAFLDFLDSTDADVIALGQGGDFIGGSVNQFVKNGFSRKAMNAFFIRTSRPYYFLGRINEDVCAYVLGNHQGKKIFTSAKISITQKQTQSNPGGLTTIYLAGGTYLKSFYSVVCCPSAVKVKSIGHKNRARIHHAIAWNNCAPLILPERCKKWRQNQKSKST